jgi:hypothetical protein
MVKKQTNPKNGKESRHIGVLLEHMDSKLDLVVEGQHVLGNQIQQVDQKVDVLKQEMDYKFDVVFDELHLIRNDLKEKVGRDEFVALEKRVVHLEKKFSRSGN